MRLSSRSARRRGRRRASDLAIGWMSVLRQIWNRVNHSGIGMVFPVSRCRRRKALPHDTGPAHSLAMPQGSRPVPAATAVQPRPNRRNAASSGGSCMQATARVPGDRRCERPGGRVARPRLPSGLHRSGSDRTCSASRNVNACVRFSAGAGACARRAVRDSGQASDLRKRSNDVCHGPGDGTRPGIPGTPPGNFRPTRPASSRPVIPNGRPRPCQGRGRALTSSCPGGRLGPFAGIGLHKEIRKMAGSSPGAGMPAILAWRSPLSLNAASPAIGRLARRPALPPDGHGFRRGPRPCPATRGQT